MKKITFLFFFVMVLFEAKAQINYRYCLQFEKEVNLTFAFDNAEINEQKYSAWSKDSTYLQLVNDWKDQVIKFVNDNSMVKLCDNNKINRYSLILSITSVDYDGETYALLSLVDNEKQFVIDSDKLNPNGGKGKTFSEAWMYNTKKIAKGIIKYISKFRESY